MRRPSVIALAAGLCVALAPITNAAAPKADVQADAQAATPAPYSDLKIGALVDISLRTDDNESLVLELERFSPFAEDAQIIRVDERGFEHPIDLSANIHLRGVVASDPDRIVYLNMSDGVTRGFISAGSEHALLITNEHGQLHAARVNALDLAPNSESCQVDVNDPRFNPFNIDTTPIDETIAEQTNTLNRGASTVRVAKVAVETDWEFTESFGGSTGASSAYAASLIGAVSTVYERDLNTQLQISYLRVYEANTDPYGGSDIGDFLGQVQSEFNSGDLADVDRAIVQGLSTRNLGGGVAYLSTACSDFWGIGVSANLNAFYPDPIQDNSHDNWDLMVVAHEMGHNFGSGHTHDSYSPTIDDCGNGDCSDALDSTIMSYCHICPGGLSNVDMRLHPRVQTRIDNYFNSPEGACIETVDVACPADLSLDGQLDFSDVSAFLADLPDLTNDGRFDFADVAEFLNLFAQGCP